MQDDDPLEPHQDPTLQPNMDYIRELYDVLAVYDARLRASSDPEEQHRIRCIIEELRERIIQDENT